MNKSQTTKPDYNEPFEQHLARHRVDNDIARLWFSNEELHKIFEGLAEVLELADEGHDVVLTQDTAKLIAAVGALMESQLNDLELHFKQYWQEVTINNT